MTQCIIWEAQEKGGGGGQDREDGSSELQDNLK